MTQYIVYDKTANEREEFYAVTPAKKWMKERIAMGHEVSGSKIKIYSDGEFVNCGPIELKGRNTAFVANTKAKKANY